MTPERWKMIEELYHAVRMRPSTERSAFLVDRCAGDETLRREVESLLNEPSSAGDPLVAERVAGPIVAAALAGDDTGRTLGGYRLQTVLGIGGMGKVYRARDITLGRDVAIKILPSGLTTDPGRLARFEREARILAALNHPNVCAIYGLEEDEGIRFLVLELVDGETLSARLAPRPLADLEARSGRGLPLAQALAIARQLAAALDAAHQKGIVHRDLKPANITITPDDVVKVLDFGLAKEVRAEAAEDAAKSPVGSTLEGVILGTAAYMSPQQARGQVLDKRADIWAFGCVLYEMLTGRVAFDGETVSDTIGKILEREPDWSALPGDTPPQIRQLLIRCLAKDPRQRLRDIGDARIDIGVVGEQAAPASTLMRPRARASWVRSAWIPWTAALILGAVAVWQTKRLPLAAEDPLARAQFTRLTNWEGTESGAEISPDGRFVAFVSDKAGEFDIWLTQVGTGEFRNLTADFPPLQNSGPVFRKFGFSADGSEIWFSPDTGPAMAQMIMPILGGDKRAFLDRFATAPSWSPDGSRLAYFKNQAGDPLFVADRTGTNSRQIHAAGNLHNHNPVWSSDGTWLYFASGFEPTDAMDVWRVRSSGGRPERMTRGSTAVNFVTPLDPRTLLFVGRDEDRSGPWLWAVDVERKTVRRVSSGLGQYTSVSASRDGRRVVATVANPTSSLWRVPLLDRQADDRDAQPYAMPTDRALAPRFKHGSLFYLSSRGPGDGLWQLRDGRASEVWKSADGRLAEPVAASPDASHVAIVLRKDGRKHLVVTADGRSSRIVAPSLDLQVTAGQSAADWSPDGRWIVAAGRDDRLGAGLFKIAVDSGTATRLVAGQAGNPVWSPDGSKIVYSDSGKLFTSQVELMAVRPEDGARVDLPLTRARPGGYRFLPDGSGLVYQQFIPSLDFWLVDFSTGTSRQLTRLSNGGAIGTFDITPDGTAIVFDRTKENSDIVLIERGS